MTPEQQALYDQVATLRARRLAGGSFHASPERCRPSLSDPLDGWIVFADEDDALAAARALLDASFEPHVAYPCSRRDTGGAEHWHVRGQRR